MNTLVKTAIILKFIVLSIVASALTVHLSHARSEQTHAPQLIGHVEGLSGEVSIKDTSGQVYYITDNGQFDFSAISKLEIGDRYHLVISKMPLGQVCKLIDGRGILNQQSSSVGPKIKCKDLQYYLGGKVRGLEGRLMVQTQLGDIRQIKADGEFTMHRPMPIGTPYAITAVATPDHQDCKIINGNGIIETNHINSIEIRCRNRLSPTPR